MQAFREALYVLGSYKSQSSAAVGRLAVAALEEQRHLPSSSSSASASSSPLSWQTALKLSSHPSVAIFCGNDSPKSQHVKRLAATALLRSQNRHAAELVVRHFAGVSPDIACTALARTSGGARWMEAIQLFQKKDEVADENDSSSWRDACGVDVCVAVMKGSATWELAVKSLCESSVAVRDALAPGAVSEDACRLLLARGLWREAAALIQWKRVFSMHIRCSIISAAAQAADFVIVKNIIDTAESDSDRAEFLNELLMTTGHILRRHPAAFNSISHVEAVAALISSHKKQQPLHNLRADAALVELAARCLSESQRSLSKAAAANMKPSESKEAAATAESFWKHALQFLERVENLGRIRENAIATIIESSKFDGDVHDAVCRLVASKKPAGGGGASAAAASTSSASLSVSWMDALEKLNESLITSPSSSGATTVSSSSSSSPARTMCVALQATLAAGKTMKSMQLVEMLADSSRNSNSNSKSSPLPVAAAEAAASAVFQTRQWFAALDALVIASRAESWSPAVGHDLVKAAVSAERWEFALRMMTVFSSQQQSKQQSSSGKHMRSVVAAADCFAIARVAPGRQWRRCLAVLKPVLTSAMMTTTTTNSKKLGKWSDRNKNAAALTTVAVEWQRQDLVGWLLLHARHNSAGLIDSIAKLRSRFPAFKVDVSVLRGRVALHGDWATVLRLGGNTMSKDDSFDDDDVTMISLDISEPLLKALNRCPFERLPHCDKLLSMLKRVAAALVVDSATTRPLALSLLLLRVAQRRGIAGVVAQELSQRIDDLAARDRGFDAQLNTAGSLVWCASVIALATISSTVPGKASLLYQTVFGGDVGIDLEFSERRAHELTRPTVALLFQCANRGILPAKVMSVLLPESMTPPARIAAAAVQTSRNPSSSQVALAAFGRQHAEWLGGCSVTLMQSDQWSTVGTGGQCLRLSWNRSSLAAAGSAGAIRVVEQRTFDAGDSRCFIIFKPAGLSVDDCICELRAHVRSAQSSSSSSSSSSTSFICPFHVPVGASGLVVLHDPALGECHGNIRIAAVVEAADLSVATDGDADRQAVMAALRDGSLVKEHGGALQQVGLKLVGDKNKLLDLKSASQLVKLDIDFGRNSAAVDDDDGEQQQRRLVTVGHEALSVVLDRLRQQRLVPVEDADSTNNVAVFVRGVSLRFPAVQRDFSSIDSGLTKAFVKQFHLA